MTGERSLVGGHIYIANKIKSQDSNPGLSNYEIEIGKLRMFLHFSCLKKWDRNCM